MPCEKMSQRLAARERMQLEREREKALKEIEEALARGVARIVKQPNGQCTIVGAALPKGMYDLCVLAKLQERNSAAFKQAMGQAQAQGANFVHQHHLAHLKGGKH